MNYDEYKKLKGLLVQIFDKAVVIIEQHELANNKDCLPERVHELLVEDYPIYSLKDKPSKDDAIGILAAEPLFPAEEDMDTVRFFTDIWAHMNGPNPSHVISNAGLALRVLSEALKYHKHGMTLN